MSPKLCMEQSEDRAFPNVPTPSRDVSVLTLKRTKSRCSYRRIRYCIGYRIVLENCDDSRGIR